MDQYKTLQQGTNNNLEAVKKLQQTLYEDGYTQVGNIDGIYGPKTAAAVKAYQTKNQLQADGIAGNETLSHLYRQKTPEKQGLQSEALQSKTLQAETPQSEVPEVPQVEAPEQVSATAQQEREKLNTMVSQAEQSWQAQQAWLQELYDNLVNRPAFSYNINEDALFAQYSDQYRRGGVLAMQDAMGQAAALTGGYGSSYGQAAGQQVYQQHMAGLADVIPTLEQNAYSRYRQDYEDQLDQYALAWQKSNEEYSRYMDALQQQWQELDYAQGREDLAWEREQAREQENYSKLISLLSVGYNPSDEELTAAGMTREQANAYINSYKASRTVYSAPQDTKETAKIDLKSLGFDDHDALEKMLTQHQSVHGNEGLRDLLDYWTQLGYINEAAMDALYCRYANDKFPSGRIHPFWGSTLGGNQVVLRAANTLI